MGLHIYSIYVINKEIECITSNGTWKLVGKSKYSLADVSHKLEEGKFTIKSVDNFKYAINKCIEVRIINEDENVKGYELKGCFSCFEYGLNECYNIIKHINDNISSVYVNVLGENIEFEELGEFKREVQWIYEKKYVFFKKGHPKFNYLILPSQYYRKYNIYNIKMKILSILQLIKTN